MYTLSSAATLTPRGEPRLDAERPPLLYVPVSRAPLCPNTPVASASASTAWAVSPALGEVVSSSPGPQARLRQGTATLSASAHQTPSKRRARTAESAHGRDIPAQNTFV